VVVVMLCGACKKSDEEAASGPEPQVLDITLQLTSPTAGKLTFRVVDGKQQPVAPPATRVDVEVTSDDANQRCTGWADVPFESFTGADKRATADVEFTDCTPPGDLKSPVVRVSLKSSTKHYASGDARPDKLSFPAAAPVGVMSPELDAALAKLTPIARDVPTSGSPCTPAVAKIDATTPVEVIQYAELMRLTGDDSVKEPFAYSPTNLFSDLASYREQRVKEPAKLLERFAATKYMIVVRANKMTMPKLVSGQSFQSGAFEGLAVLVELPSGKALCAYPVIAQSSTGVKLTEDPKDLENDLRGNIATAIREGAAEAFPAIKLGAHTDRLAK
jgi:hypothetical protein